MSWNHSLKDSLEARTVLIEIFMLCWNLERPKTPGITSNMDFLISCLQESFVLIWIKQTLIWFNLQRNGTGNRFVISRIFFQKFCSYKCQFCTKVCASSRLVSQVQMMVGENIKKKHLMCQVPIKMFKHNAIPNSRLHSKRFIHQYVA